MSKKHQSTAASGSEYANRHKQRSTRKRNMAALWIGLGIVVVFALAILVLRPSASPSAPTTSLTEITVVQAHERYLAGALFVDVRTQAEWDRGHIARSTLIPLDVLQTRMNELPRDKDIVVVCRSGARSKEGSTLLRQAGFTCVTCMTGGIQAWVAAGYPIEQ